MLTNSKNLSLQLKKKNLKALLVSNPANIFYFAGFKGVSAAERESFLVCSNKRATLFAPRLYSQEALALEGKGLKIRIVAERDKLFAAVLQSLRQLKSGRVGIEGDNLRVLEYETLRQQLGTKRLSIQQDLVERLKEIKSEKEIELINQAQLLSLKAFKQILPLIQAGITEEELADKLKQAMLRLGAEKESFAAIVASGSNSALPHYTTGKRRLKKGDMILFDFGAVYQGYCGDATRMVFLGQPTVRMRQVYELVKQAQLAGINAIQPGVKADEAFAASNQVFIQNKVAKNFTHGLGHGIGKEIHENPYLRQGSSVKLQAGMVFSVEPGLYFPGWGGIRLEDLVVCRQNGVGVLGEPVGGMLVV